MSLKLAPLQPRTNAVSGDYSRQGREVTAAHSFSLRQERERYEAMPEALRVERRNYIVALLRREKASGRNTHSALWRMAAVFGIDTEAL